VIIGLSAITYGRKVDQVVGDRAVLQRRAIRRGEPDELVHNAAPGIDFGYAMQPVRLTARRSEVVSFSGLTLKAILVTSGVGG
jgi:hypothetical protein